MSRILIAEDEPRIAAFIQKGLQKNGFTTAIAVDGEQASQMLYSNEFDMLLLDLGLPLKGGLVVLTELRSRGIQIPIIVVSARDDIEEKKASLKNGANDYVTKPFRFQDLLQSVRYHLKTIV